MFFGDDSGYYNSWNDISEEEHELVLKAAYREEQEKKRNVNRDKRGRLNKGARLAQKDSCKADKILSLYQNGMTVREIVDQLRCSKSTVYNVLKERNNLKMYLLYMGGCTVQKVAHAMQCSEEAVIFAIRKFSDNAVASILESDKPI